MDIPKNKRALKKALFEWRCDQFPDRPKHTLGQKALPWTCGKDIENLIEQHCNMLAWYGVPIACSIIDVNGTYIKGYGWAPSNTTKGVSDVHITYKGVTHWVEAKYGTDTQKKAQKEFQEKQEKAGATYTIVKVYEDWFDFLDSLLN